MIKFLKGYYEKNGRRINEWEVDGELIKTSYTSTSPKKIEPIVTVIEGNVTKEVVAEMQKMVYQSIEDTENGR